MNLDTTLLRHSAVVAAVVAGWFLAAAQDPPAPAPVTPPTIAPATPPAAPATTPPATPPSTAAPSTPKPEGDPFGEKPELFDDAFKDFGAGDENDAAPDPGAARNPMRLFDDAFRMFDDDFFNDPRFQPFAMRIDPQAFRLGQQGGAGTYDSTTMENGATKRIRVDVAADGKAKATITTQQQDGEKTEKSFEADSVEELQALAPELKSAFDGSFGALGHALTPRALGRLSPRSAPKGLQRLPRSQDTPLAPQPSGRKLGVQVKAIEADDPLRAHLRLDDGVGLLVEAVVPGSLADALKLERYDVITKINDLSIGEAADVAIALNQAGDGALEVHVVRGGKELRLTKDT